ncbi:unnamed protein product, partial [Discosporangium mesarthrocarpum]
RAWETQCDAWRQLRHNRAVAEFHQDVTADRFVNPSARTALFRCYREGQQRRHEKRLGLLRGICRLRP